jgi:hypothetical protein
MIGEAWSRGSVGLIVGAVFGAILSVLAMASAAGGHGTYLPLAIFGAPISLVAGGWFGFLAVPIVWAAIGLAVGAARPPLVAAIVLALHLVGVGAVVVLGSTYESSDEQWHYLERAQVQVGRAIRVALLTYAAGLVTAWGTVVIRGLRQRRRGRHSSVA